MKADYVKSDSFRLLVNSMQYENGLAISVCIETGLRIGDVLKIKPDDLDGCRLSYIAEKTGKSGVKTISRSLATALRRIAGKNWVFEGRGSTKTGHRTRQAVYRDLKRVCKRLGVEGQISPHSARKTYAVADFRKNGLAHVKRELQHSDDSVTLLYALSDQLQGGYFDDGSRQILQAILDIVTDLQQTVNTIAKSLR